MFRKQRTRYRSTPLPSQSIVRGLKLHGCGIPCPFTARYLRCTYGIILLLRLVVITTHTRLPSCTLFLEKNVPALSTNTSADMIASHR